MKIADTILEKIIVTSQRTPFRGKGGYTNLPLEQQAKATGLDKARAEAADAERFFTFFPDHDVRAAMRGKRVLDFGSGYGGRTVAYAKEAESVYGVEVVQAHVDAGKELADEVGADNAHFSLCGEFDIPHEDDFFDVIVTFDVLEHVTDPRHSLTELHRVLKPGGVMFAVFPVYRGMFAHHLDYITLAPALHLFFDADRIMRVVNRLLDGRYRHIHVSRHEGAQADYLGKRRVLPMLNGMGLRDFKEAASAFDIESLDQVSIGRRLKGDGSLVALAMAPFMALPPVISEAFTFHICALLRAKA